MIFVLAEKTTLLGLFRKEKSMIDLIIKLLNLIRFMKKKESENSSVTKKKTGIDGNDEFANSATSMVDIVVRIKDDDTFGK